MLRGLAGLLSVLLGGCLAKPFEPPAARHSAAPPVYTSWWQDMEVCAQRSAPLDRIEWYAVPGDHFGTPEGPRWGWWEPPHTIYIADAHWWDARLVEHEMLHDLLQSSAHPSLFQACGVAAAVAGAG